MKPIKKLPLYIFLCCTLFACQQVPEDDNWVSKEESQSLKVKVRSAENVEISYPLFLYAFDKDGKLAASQNIEKEENGMMLTLGNGDFQLVAIAGTSDAYLLPDSPTIDDVIIIDGTEGAETPLMVGKADIGISRSSEKTAEITMSYVVAELNVKLTNVPTDVEIVQLAISPLYSSLSMGGKYGGDTQKVKVECTLNEDGAWTAQSTYIFPGSGKETTFSIYFKKADGTELTYGYTYQGKPEANHPFNITGSYAEGVIVGGSFEISGWEEAIDVEFTFGANAVPGVDEEEPEEPEIDLTNVPEIGTIWNDAIVADIGEADETGVDLLLLSLDEWDATTSQVSDVIEGYSVNGISDWRLPTHEEAAVLRARFSGDSRLELNDLIEEYDSSLYGVDGEERYLCTKNDVYYSFKFAGGTTTTKAGEKRSYYVRLVKTYRVAI